MGRSAKTPAIDLTVSTDQPVSAAIAGDELASAALAERHRRELHVHCYRMPSRPG